MSHMVKKHLLFICTANVCRSPTAASLFQNSETFEAKSAGTHIVSGHPEAVLVDEKLISWADEIFVMSEKEDHHLSYLKSHFSLHNKKIHILDIPNIYDTSFPEQKEKLIRILCHKLSSYLPPSCEYAL